MIYRYESPTQRRLVFGNAEGTSLTLPVSPELLALVTHWAESQPAVVLEKLQEALGQAGEMLEELRCLLDPPQEGEADQTAAGDARRDQILPHRDPATRPPEAVAVLYAEEMREIEP